MAEKELPSIDIVLDEARRTLDFQFEQLDALDTKSGIILGIAGVVITLLISAVIRVPDLSNSLTVKIMLSIITVTLFISLFLSYWNLRIRQLHRPAETATLVSNHVFKVPHTTKADLVGTIEQAVRINQEIIDKRFCLYKHSYNILFIGLLMVTASMITLLFIQ